MGSDPTATPHLEEPAPKIAASDEPLATELVAYLKSALPQLQVKDWIVAVPLLASCIAITYELGSFSPLSSESFALFSLSDHVLWAIEVLPVAFATSAGILVTGAFILIFERRQTTEVKPAEQASGFIPERFKSAAFLFGFGILGILYSVYVKGPDSARGVLTLLAPFCVMLLVLIPNWVRSRVLLTGAFIVFMALAYVFAWGSDHTSSMLESKRLSTFDFGGNNVKYGILVRSGEHGLLIYDPENRELTFAKMAELKNLRWKRWPLPWENVEEKSKAKP
jgi:hypothetical protein